MGRRHNRRPTALSRRVAFRYRARTGTPEKAHTHASDYADRRTADGRIRPPSPSADHPGLPRDDAAHLLPGLRPSGRPDPRPVRRQDAEPRGPRRLREQYHLDQPFIVQYFYYITGIFQGDFGTSFNGQPVTEQLVRAFPITIRLALLAILFEMIIGITLGLIAGLTQGRHLRRDDARRRLVLISLPIFVIAFTAQFVLRPSSSAGSGPRSGQGAPLPDLVLPAIVLASINFAVTLRLTRSSVIDTQQPGLRADGVRQGPPDPARHPRAHPAQLAHPGHDRPRRRLRHPDRRRDRDRGHLQRRRASAGRCSGRSSWGRPPTVVSFVTVMVILYLIVNLLIDLLYGVLDPRIRYVK